MYWFVYVFDFSPTTKSKFSKANILSVSFTGYVLVPLNMCLLSEQINWWVNDANGNGN